MKNITPSMVDEIIAKDISVAEEFSIMINIKLRNLTYIDKSLYDKLRDKLDEMETSIFNFKNKACILIECNDKHYIQEIKT